ncbi:MAG: hypothetical protein V1798_07230, partial [Pseudomonadota bacterium]
MTSAWRWKAWAAFISTLLAVWFVLPNLVEEAATKEDLAKRPWYERVLPNSRVRLGLDLQGGINMVLGIDLRRALMNEADRYVRDLKDYLPKEQVGFNSIDRAFDSTQIKVVLKSADEQSKFERYLETHFPYVSVAERDAKTGTYVLDISQEKKADVEKQTVEQALETLRSRLDEFGVAEPSIQARGNDQIIIQLPGMDDPERAKSVLGRTAQLEFKIVDDESMEPRRLDLLVQEAKTTLPKNFKLEDLNRALQGK